MTGLNIPQALLVDTDQEFAEQFDLSEIYKHQPHYGDCFDGHDSEAIQQEFQTLENKFSSHKALAAYRPYIKTAFKNLLNKEHAGTIKDKARSFSAIKKNLERLYCHLINEANTKRCQEIPNIIGKMFEAMNCCAPGMVNKVQAAHDAITIKLANPGFPQWLSAYRTHCIDRHTSLYIQENRNQFLEGDRGRIRAGNQTHVRPNFMQYAINEGWNPHGRSTFEPDDLANLARVSADDLSHFHHNFLDAHELEPLYQHLRQCFIDRHLGLLKEYSDHDCSQAFVCPRNEVVMSELDSLFQGLGLSQAENIFQYPGVDTCYLDEDSLEITLLEYLLNIYSGLTSSEQNPLSAEAVAAGSDEALSDNLTDAESLRNALGRIKCWVRDAAGKKSVSVIKFVLDYVVQIEHASAVLSDDKQAALLPEIADLKFNLLNKLFCQMALSHGFDWNDALKNLVKRYAKTINDIPKMLIELSKNFCGYLMQSQVAAMPAAAAQNNEAVYELIIDIDNPLSATVVKLGGDQIECWWLDDFFLVNEDVSKNQLESMRLKLVDQINAGLQVMTSASFFKNMYYYCELQSLIALPVGNEVAEDSALFLEKLLEAYYRKLSSGEKSDDLLLGLLPSDYDSFFKLLRFLLKHQLNLFQPHAGNSFFDVREKVNGFHCIESLGLFDGLDDEINSSNLFNPLISRIGKKICTLTSLYHLVELEKISLIFSFLIVCVSDKQFSELIAALSTSAEAGDDKGETAAYCLALSLSFAASNNGIEAVREISAIWVRLLERCPDDQWPCLMIGLSAPAEADASKGMSAVYCLALALEWAVRHNKVEALEKISAIWVRLLERCPDDQWSGLMAALSAPAEADASKGMSAVYCLALALEWAVRHNKVEALEKISAIWVRLLERCPDDHWPVLIAGLSTSVKAGPNKGKSAAYWLALSLKRAAFDNKIEALEKSSAIWVRLLERCPDDQWPVLIAGLSTSVKAGPNKGKSAVYYLASSLCCAVYHNKIEAVREISAIWVRMLERCPDDQWPVLIAGLSTSVKAGPNKGKSAVCWLALSLGWAGRHNKIEALEKSSGIWVRLLKRCPDDQWPVLIAGLSALVEAGDDKGKSAVYWLALSLKRAAFDNKIEAVREISAILGCLLERCPDDQWPVLIAGLSTLAEAADDKERSAVCCLALALEWAVRHNKVEALEKISAIWVRLLESCPDDHWSGLMAGLLASVEAGDGKERSAVYWLAHLLERCPFEYMSKLFNSVYSLDWLKNKCIHYIEKVKLRNLRHDKSAMFFYMFNLLSAKSVLSCLFQTEVSNINPSFERGRLGRLYSHFIQAVDDLDDDSKLKLSTEDKGRLVLLLAGHRVTQYVSTERLKALGRLFEGMSVKEICQNRENLLLVRQADSGLNRKDVFEWCSIFWRSKNKQAAEARLGEAIQRCQSSVSAAKRGGCIQLLEKVRLELNNGAGKVAAACDSRHQDKNASGFFVVAEGDEDSDSLSPVAASVA